MNKPKKKLTMLERARMVNPIRHRRASEVDPEELELALAFVRGEVSVMGLADTVGITRGGVGSWVGRILSAAIREGRLVEK